MPPLCEPLFVNYNPGKHVRQGESDIIVQIRVVHIGDCVTKYVVQSSAHCPRRETKRSEMSIALQMLIRTWCR